MAALMNAEQYARHRGVTKKAAAQWCRQGKIPAVRIGKEWQIDPVAADAALPETQDTRQPRRATAPRAPVPEPVSAPAPQAAPPAKPPADRSNRKAPPSPPAKPAGPTLADAQRALAVYKAERERLALEQDKGELVYRADFVTAQNAVAAQIMNRAETLPRQIKQAIPHLLIEEVEKIERLVKEMLEAVANWSYEEVEE